MGKIATLWPKTCSLTATRVILHIRKPDGVLIDHEVPEVNYQLCSAAGEPICDLVTAIHGSINTLFAVAVEELARTAPPDGGTTEIDARADPWEMEFEGRMQAPHVRVEHSDPQTPIEFWVIEQASFEVLATVTPEAPFDLRHQDVAGSATAFGEMRVADHQGVLVITEGSSGARATFRARKDGEKKWRDIPVQPTAALEDPSRSEPSTGAQ